MDSRRKYFSLVTKNVFLACAASIALAGATLSWLSQTASADSVAVARESTNASSAVLYVNNGDGPLADNFNPFVPSNDAGLVPIYEPLLQFDQLKPGTVYPWLATKYDWSNAGKTITFTIRPHVSWSSGRPFSSSDVAFTFSMLKRFPSLNTLALPIVSATTDGMTKAVIDFSRPAYTLLQQIGSTDIVPAYIWQGVKDPSKFADTDPVGTGPYMLQRFSTAGIWVVRNPHYWQPNNSGIERIYAAAYTSGTAAQLALETGQDQWAGLFVPNYQKLYVAKAPKYNVFWSPATGTVSLEPNNTIYPLNIPLVRKALAFAINRASVGNIGESGTELPVTSAVGLPMPTFKSYVAANYAGKNYSYDPSEAVKLLEKAGLRRNSKGVFLGKNGAPITLSIVDPSGYTDYMADAEIIAKELDNIGLHTSVDGVSVALWTTDYIDGKFDMTIRWSRGGGTPFFIYQGWLDGTETAPVGKAATGDYERFHSAAATGLLAEYGSTDNAAKQASLMAKLEGIVANAVPVVPLVGAANWDQHSTKEFVGWPTPTNPYILPSPDMPDMEVTILHLRPRG